MRQNQLLKEDNARLKSIINNDSSNTSQTVKALSVSLYSEGVMSNDRIAAFLNAAGDGELGLSEGSVYAFTAAEGTYRKQNNFP